MKYSKCMRKRSLFFYFALASVLLLVVMIVFDTVSYITTINSYITQGYTKEVVLAYMPVFGTLMPTYSSEIGIYGLLAALLFFADALMFRFPKPIPFFCAPEQKAAEDTAEDIVEDTAENIVEDTAEDTAENNN